MITTNTFTPKSTHVIDIGWDYFYATSLTEAVDYAFKHFEDKHQGTDPLAITHFYEQSLSARISPLKKPITKKQAIQLLKKDGELALEANYDQIFITERKLALENNLQLIKLMGPDATPLKEYPFTNLIAI